MGFLINTANLHPPRRRARIFRVAVCASLAAHAGLIALVLLLPRQAQTTEAPIEVSVLMDAVPEPPAPPPPRPEPRATPTDAPAPAAVVAARPAPPKAPQDSPPPPAEPPVPPATPPTATAPVAPEPAEATPDDSAGDVKADPTATDRNAERPLLVATAAGGASHRGGGPYRAVDGTGTGAGEGVPLSDARRRTLTDRYRDGLLRTQIAAHFRYPEEARELELVGQVIIAVTVQRDGRIISARVAGRCPHTVLCEDGMRTVRAAAPFPPIPTELGETLQVEVPFNYSFE